MDDLTRERLEEKILEISTLKKQEAKWNYTEEGVTLIFRISWTGPFGRGIAKRVLQHHMRELAYDNFVEISCTEQNMEAAFAEAKNIQEQIKDAEERLEIKIFEFAGV